MNNSTSIQEIEARTLYRGFERVFWGLLIAVLSSHWFRAERGGFYLFSVVQGIGGAIGFLVMILGLRLLTPRHPNFARAKWATWVWLFTAVAFTILPFFSKSSRGSPSWDPSGWSFSLFPGVAGLAFLFALLVLMLLIAWWIAGGIAALARKYQNDKLAWNARRWRVLYLSSIGLFVFVLAISSLPELVPRVQPPGFLNDLRVIFALLILAIIIYWVIFLLFLALLRRAALLGARWGESEQVPDNGD